MAEITIVDYGLGNIKAFVDIYKRLNISIHVASTIDTLKRATHLILPGVGAFDWAMSRLNSSGLRSTLDQLVLERGIPVLGVCVGMQMMALSSEEGTMAGLGWLDAEVVQFDREQLDLPALPHMGWNDVHPQEASKLFRDITEPRFYFLHTYYLSPNDPQRIIATCDYGAPFTAAVSQDHIYGTQFHPEKSHSWGIALLNNFALL